MAIPKYQREKVSAQTRVEQFGGLEAEAEARGQAGIAQAQKGLSAQYGQRAGQEISTLTQRLGQFDSYLGGMMQKDASQRAREAGVIDTSERRAQIMQVRKQYGDNPEKMNEEIGKIETATATDNFSIFGTIYQSTVNSAFANQSEIDATNADQMAQSIAAGDPEKYKTAYQAYNDEVIRGAPNELGKIAAHKAFEKRGTSTYERLYRAQQSSFMSGFKENVKGNISGLQTLIKDAAARGDKASVNAYRGQLAALTQAEVNNGRMGGAEAMAVNQKMTTAAQVEEAMRYGNEAANMGTGWDFMRKLKNPNHPYGKMFEQLPADAQAEVLNKTRSATDSYQKAELGKEKHLNDTVSTKQITNTRDLKEEIFAGRTYTLGELQDFEANGDIDAGQAKSIRELQEQKTDEPTMAYFDDKQILLSMSVGEIQELPDISYEDKRKLMNKRETALKDPLYDWTKSREGEEALRRLAADYGTAEKPMYMIPGKPDENQIEYNNMRTELFDRIQSLPYKDQPGAALKIYKELKGDLDEKKETRKLEKQERKDKTSWDEAVTQASKENEGWFTDGVTPEDVLGRKNSAGYTRKLTDKYSQPITPKPKLKKPATPRLPPLTVYKPITQEYQAKAAQFGLGGSRSWRNKNQGNLEYGAFAKKYGAIGTDGRFAIFPTEEAGERAQTALLQSKNYKDLNLNGMVNRYAPSNENDTIRYVNVIKQALKKNGISTAKKMGNYTQEEMKVITDAMKIHEGYKPGSQS